ncbi:MAG: hypothetical protein E7197_05895 [Anaerovibrio sp.]|nr:hypothetical protein [Anaerovibrio sp.]
MYMNETSNENSANIFGCSAEALESITSVMRSSDLIIIAESQGISKSTSIVLKIGADVALDEDKAVAFFSLKLSKNQLMRHMLCLKGGINYQKLNNAELNKNDWKKLENVANEIAEAPFYIDDTPNMTATDLRTKACCLKQEKGLGLIIVDSLQQLNGPSENENMDASRQEILQLLSSLKAVATELEVPVTASLQLTKSLDIDSLECYSLEQYADFVKVLN